MIKFCKKWWFYLTMPIVVISAVLALGSHKELKPYDDYIFYGIAQNKVVGKERLKVNFLVKGFPLKDIQYMWRLLNQMVQ